MSLLDPTAPLRGILVSLVGAAVLFGGGYLYRMSGDSERYAELYARDVKASYTDLVKRDAKASVAAKETQTEKEKLRVVYRNLPPRIEWLKETRVEYLHVCLPADGVRSWNDANAGRYERLQQGGVDRAVPEDAPPVP